MKNNKFKIYSTAALLLAPIFIINGGKHNVTCADEIVTYDNEYTNDEVIYNYFNGVCNDIKIAIDDNDIDKVKKLGKNVITSLIEFIFFDKEIMGITKNDISDTTKELLCKLLVYISSLLEKYAPDYKVLLDEKYRYIVDYLGTTYEDIKEYIGDENIDKIHSIFESTGEVIEDVMRKVIS